MKDLVFLQIDHRLNERAGINLPVDTLHVRTGVLLHGSTAYATTNIIRIPITYTTSDITTNLAQHEIAHAARHSMDGSMAHFLYDVTRFGYTRRHSCNTKSNYGYAFSEGWAEFWAGACKRFSGYGSSKTDYRYERNVAQSLRRLRSACSSSDHRFISILKNNRGKIHSFWSFNNPYKKAYGCKI